MAANFSQNKVKLFMQSALSPPPILLSDSDLVSIVVLYI